MTPSHTENLERLQLAMKDKDEECQEHQALIRELQKAIAHPECGLAIKMARIEERQKSHGETLEELAEGQKWIVRGIVLVLLTVVGYAASQWVESHDVRSRPGLASQAQK